MQIRWVLLVYCYLLMGHFMMIRASDADLTAVPAKPLDRERLTVASLNPIASDLARQVGGDWVRIVELMKPGQDPHLFSPSPSDLRAAADASLMLAMGKGLETYIQSLRQLLRDDQRLFEIGERLPSLCSRGAVCHEHGSRHSHGPDDPHWWHSLRNMRRAAWLLAEAFGEVMPEKREVFVGRARDYQRRLDDLDAWAREMLHAIPQEHRQLTTAHAAFNYFCNEYGFEPIPVLGLSTQEHPRPRQLHKVIDTLRRKQVRAVFPEKATNPALLETLASEAGVRTGGWLLAGSPTPDEPTFEAMFRHNVITITDALLPEGNAE